MDWQFSFKSQFFFHVDTFCLPCPEKLTRLQNRFFFTYSDIKEEQEKQ